MSNGKEGRSLELQRAAAQPSSSSSAASASAAGASRSMFSGFSFKKKADDSTATNSGRAAGGPTSSATPGIEPSLAGGNGSSIFHGNNQKKQDETSCRVEAITTFDASCLERPVNLPVIDLGLDLKRLAEEDKVLVEERKKRKILAGDVDLVTNAKSGAAGASKVEAGEQVAIDVVDEEQGGLRGIAASSSSTVATTTVSTTTASTSSTSANQAQQVTEDEAAAAILAELQNPDTNEAAVAAGGSSSSSAAGPVIHGLVDQRAVDTARTTPSKDKTSTTSSSRNFPTSTTTASTGTSASSSGMNQKKAALFGGGAKKRKADGARPILSKRSEGVTATDVKADEQFENMDIADFGWAYLRGLGYDESKHRVNMVKLEGQTKNLGLGATNVLLPTDHLVAAGTKGKGKGGAGGKNHNTSTTSSTTSIAAAGGNNSVAAPVENGAVAPQYKASSTSATSSAGASSLSSSASTKLLADSKNTPLKTWLRRGLIVKICDERCPAYCKKGPIVKVEITSSTSASAIGSVVATVQAKVKEGKEKVNKTFRVKEKHLEPTIIIPESSSTNSSSSSVVKRIRTGSRKSEWTSLRVLKADKENNTATLVDPTNGGLLNLTLRDVCAFDANEWDEEEVVTYHGLATSSESSAGAKR
ncbi:unnamed protein product [Amoebophrya sp. A25]|nr:unnamed protein product [Amoebophrya sp. A25]|eukprot:GSA25T00022078001.1